MLSAENSWHVESVVTMSGWNVEEAAALSGMPHPPRARPLHSADPRQLGGYELLGRLGEGGMGRVYLARDTTGRLVAIKVIREALAEKEDFRRRFRKEVERASTVPPFCTAEVLGADPDHDPPYLVIEYIDGPSLSYVVDTAGPLSTANLYSLAIGMAAALTAIHGAGVIHRDLKPSNVLLAPGSAKVIDFGISRPVDASATSSTGNHVLGTVAYMSPERFGADAGQTLTPAADIFAWGAVVVFAGTGRVPFPAESLPQVALRIMTDPPELTGLVGPLRSLAAQALAKDPQERPTARELLDRLITVNPAEQRGPVRQRDPVRPDEPAPVGPAEPTAPRNALVRVAPAPPPSTRRSRRWRISTGLVLGTSLLALLAAVGVVTGVVPLPHLSVTAERTGTTPGGTAGTAAPAPSIPPGFRLVVQDRLTRAGAWPLVDDGQNQATCDFDNGLVVTMARPGPYRCKGPEVLGGYAYENVAAFATVTLLTPGSCAAVWFRFYTGGYLLQVCEDGMHLFIHGLPQPNSMRLLDTFGSHLPVGVPLRIGVLATGETLRFYREDTQVEEFTADGSVPPGHVVLGQYALGNAGAPPYQVRFTDVAVWSDGG